MKFLCETNNLLDFGTKIILFDLNISNFFGHSSEKGFFELMIFYYLLVDKSYIIQIHYS